MSVATGVSIRAALVAAAVWLAAGAAPAQGVRPEWSGLYAGTVAFRGVLQGGPEPAALEAEDGAPIPFALILDAGAETIELLLRIDGGPMQTAPTGERMRFGAIAGAGPREARLLRGEGPGAAESGSLRLYPDPRSARHEDMLMIEGLHRQDDDSLWRRQLGVRFTPEGAEVLLWVFDRTGYRGRVWRGELRKLP
jgi:hypothetical protein